MTTVEVGEDEGASGLVALVVAVVELLVEALEREAVRRMESDRLSDEEADRLGRQLATLEAEVEQLKEDHGVESEVDRLRADLDGLVSEAVTRTERRESTDREATGRERSVGGPDE
jgi:hypothetical protein